MVGANVALADTCGKALTGPFPAGQATKLCISFGSAINNSLLPATSATYNLGSSSKAWKDQNLSGRLLFQGASADSGITISPLTAVAAATPVAGTNKAGRLTIFPTAALNAAVLLPAGPEDGAYFDGCNQGANAQRLKADGALGINGAAAGTYITIPTFGCYRCIYDGTRLTWLCGTLTVPTPAGP